MENDNRNQKINPTPTLDLGSDPEASCPHFYKWLLGLFNNDKEIVIAIMTAFAVHFRDSILSQAASLPKMPEHPISRI
jgi:hypothetical protein